MIIDRYTPTFVSSGWESIGAGSTHSLGISAGTSIPVYVKDAEVWKKGIMHIKDTDIWKPIKEIIKL